MKKRFSTLLAASVTAALVLSCSQGQEKLPAAGGEGLRTCQDEDGDGFGPGCELGADCNDSDPESNGRCVVADCGRTPTARGCPCEAQGEIVECGKQQGSVGENVICGYGVKTCDQGTWGSCELSLLPSGKKLTQIQAPSTCPSNPCDPHCSEFLDVPKYTTDLSVLTCSPNPTCQDGIQNQDEQGIDCGGVCTAQCSAQSDIINANFTANNGGFTYQDDLFRSTNAPSSESGGIGGGQAFASVGQIPGTAANSAGFLQDFSANEAVQVSFDWTLQLGTGFANDECGEILVSIDGTYYGVGGQDHLTQLCGSGSQTGTFTFTSNALALGSHTLRLGGYLNKNVGAGAATRLEVENYDAYHNPDADGDNLGIPGGDYGFEGTSDVGGGSNMGWTHVGDYVEWSYTAPQDGNYTINSRVAATSSSWSHNILVDGVTVDTLSGSATGGWQEWATFSGDPFPMTAGVHTIRVLLTTGGHNLNYIEVLEPAVAPQMDFTFDNVVVSSPNAATCGDATCDPTENCTNCVSDCGDCPAAVSCGDGLCDASESCNSCVSDCGQCLTACGDGTCSGSEDCGNCETDCGSCAGVGVCGNGVCDATESCTSCESDCGVCRCGDGECRSPEDCSSCAADCGACPSCGDGTCDASEDCSSCATDCGSCALSPTELYLEAECPTSAQGNYAVTQSGGYGNGHIYSSDDDAGGGDSSQDQAVFEFAIAAGSYDVYFRIDTGGSATDDSWYYRIDGGGWQTENNYSHLSSFGWAQADSGLSLSAGDHTLEVRNREDGLLMDQIAFVPSGSSPSGSSGSLSYNCGGSPPGCGDGSCGSGEDCTNCAADCGACPAGPTCGDTTCDAGEDCSSCSSDCGDCLAPPVCGDGTCNGTEDCTTCATDCGICSACGDGSCNGVETCTTCATDCGGCIGDVCGDGTCDASEDCSYCAVDCGACPLGPSCGDGTCDGTEDCSSCALDCGVCASSAVVCGDGSCDSGENCTNCDADCGACDLLCAPPVPPADPCGDATCDAGAGEDCNTCESDCGACTPAPTCGNGTCSSDDGEDCDSCPADCGPCLPTRECGDGTCEPVIGESCSTCSSDCGTCMAVPVTVCGDNTCDPAGENCSLCPADCGACPFFGTGGPFNGGVIATGNVQIHDRVTVNGDVTGSSMMFGVDATVTGNVDVDGNAATNDRTAIGGTLRVDGTLTTGNGTSTGATEAPVDVTIPTLPPITANPGGSNFYVSPGGSATLAPGQYQWVEAYAGATLTVSAGRYDFSTLYLNPHATLVVDATNGPVEFRMGTDFNVQSYVNFNIIGDASDWGVFSAANITISPFVDFPSSLYAPHGLIQVYADATVRGGIAGKDVDLQPDIVIGVGQTNIGWGTNATPPPPPPPAPVCGDSSCTPETGESCSSCGSDCGGCEALPVCGDGTCDADAREACGSCDADCGSCPVAVTCGDGTCDAADGESCSSCAADCGACAAGVGCGDGTCQANESCGSCAVDCGSCSSYQTTSFEDDFDISATCGFDQAAIWAGFSWEADAPGDSRVNIYFRSAETQAGLDSATEVKIVVAASDEANGGWKYGPEPVTGAMLTGFQLIDTVNIAEELPRHNEFARLRFELVPPTDGSDPPELTAISLQSSCLTIE